jgi:hypothetical protein
LIVQPGEPHTFLRSSPDYLHFVVQSPGLAGEAARAEKRVRQIARRGIVGTSVADLGRL